MRKIGILLVLLIVLLMPVMGTIYAQENEALFDLTETFTVADLGFEFNYPSGWVTDSSDGIYIAENEDDLAAGIDGDDTTQPEGYSITVNGIEIDALGLEEPTLDNVVEFIVTQSGITVTETLDLPVMSRRGVLIIGVNTDGRAGLATVWLQNGYVVSFAMGTSEESVSGDLGYTYGLIVGGMHPVDALELAEEPEELTDYGFSINYPADWFVISDEAGSRAYELESDFDNDAASSTPEGLALGVLGGNLEEMGMPAETTVDDLAAALLAGSEDITDLGEFLILDTPGKGFSGTQPAGGFFAAVIVIDEEAGEFTAFIVSSPDAEAYAAFENTFLTVLKSVTAIEEE
ncbi:MAG: hypothetical protein H7Y09_15375 [Chitinophagaceae bacterium]|nr:hypothetical protein [Anaerolineae bacterium]